MFHLKIVAAGYLFEIVVRGSGRSRRLLVGNRATGGRFVYFHISTHDAQIRLLNFGRIDIDPALERCQNW